MDGRIDRNAQHQEASLPQIPSFTLTFAIARTSDTVVPRPALNQEQDQGQQISLPGLGKCQKLITKQFLQLARTLTSTPAHVAAEKKTAQARQTDNIQ